MLEKDKMLAGELYDANCNELIEDRCKAKDICFEYNNLKPSDAENRDKIIKKLFAKTGEQITVEQNFWCDYGYNIHIGSHFYANTGCVMLDCGKIIIGNHVFLAPHVQLYTVNHPIHLKQRDADYEYTKPITIKDHVWIGGNTTVLPGVTIGENSIIGAGSVVTKDIPANVIAVGNPCRILRKMTKEELGLS